jgi:hypothetical protein
MFPGIGKYKGHGMRLKVFQSVGDIMLGIMATHKRYTSDYDKIAPTFDGGNTRQICQRVYNFLLDKTHYKVEPDNKQTLRSPAAILALGSDPSQGLDCKSYSLFIGGVLDALNRRGHNIKWCYRFASYRFGDRLPHHVFVVVNPGTKNELFVDPVIKPFNYQKPYFYKIDKYINMALYSISGTRRQNRAERKQKAKQAIQKTGKVLIKYNPVTVTGRNAFLLLVKLNVFKLATNLAKANSINPRELRAFWTKLGGNYTVLLNNIKQGTKKAASVGDPATAAAVTSAVPILIKVREFLKKMGLNEKDISNLSKFASTVVKKAIDKKADIEAGEDPISTDPNDILEDAGGGGNDLTFTAPADGEGLGAIPKNYLLLGGAALGIYLLTRKKR